ncbi:MAG: diguanylate cyclase [Pseudomonadota bacterium]
MNDQRIYSEKDRKHSTDIHTIDEKFIFNTIMEYSHDTFYFKDKDSRFIFISKNVALRLGIDDPEYVIGKTDFDLFDKPHAIEALKDEQEIIRTGKPILGKVEREIWQDGSSTWISTSKYPLYNKDNNIIGTWGVSRDITKLKAAEEELEHVNRELIELNQKLEILSTTDSLSGLHNHRYFYETVKKEFARKSRNDELDSVIAVVDIDNFKGLNDSHGHLIGDYAIRHVANLISSSIRKVDYAFRYGGDEFIILFVDTDIDGAVKAAEKLLDIIRATPFIMEGEEIRITISGGVAALSETDDANELIKIADKRLYISKKSGRDRITYM